MKEYLKFDRSHGIITLDGMQEIIGKVQDGKLNEWLKEKGLTFQDLIILSTNYLHTKACFFPKIEEKYFQIQEDMRMAHGFRELIKEISERQVNESKNTQGS